MKSFDKVVTELSLQQSNELFLIYCQLTYLSLHLMRFSYISLSTVLC